MFKLAETPTFKRTVTVKVPTDSGYSRETLSATYRMLTADEMTAHDLGDPEGVKTLLCECIVELGDIANESGEPLPYSDQLRDAVVSRPDCRSALIRTYIDSIAGAREGN